MQTLLGSLLDYSRVATKAEPFKETDLNGSVKAALSNLELLIQDKKGEVEVDALPSLEADPNQMIRLFPDRVPVSSSAHPGFGAPLHTRFRARVHPHVAPGEPPHSRFPETAGIAPERADA
ncbi:MAG: hypothetical protein P8175_20070 [Deltaproteobacteria bacterium]